MAESLQPIKTKRLVLREARKWDLQFIHRLHSDKDVMKYWARAPLFERLPQTEEYLTKMVESPSNGILGFVIILPPVTSPTSETKSTTASSSSTKDPVITPLDEGKVIGHAGIWLPNTDNELTFLIDRPYWSQKFITEVLETLLPIYWQKGLEIVHADVEPENGASLKLLKNLGFIQVGENIVESYKGKCATLRMEMRNPQGEKEEGKEGGDGDEDEDDDDDDDDDDDIWKPVVW